MSVHPALMVAEDGRARCAWAGAAEDYLRYHDEEWGRPQHDSRALFEKMCLEGFQAGLSWITVLRKREAFREVFSGFDPRVMATMTESDVDRLLADVRIIRHRGKLEAAISNARAMLALDTELATLMWAFAPDPIGRTRPVDFAAVPAATPESVAMSKELRRRGFRFVGPTTMYALMQATGMVDDHIDGCWRATESAVG